MGYITHNVNRFLVLLIVFISVALVTATAFFAQEFQGMNEGYDGYLDELKTLETELRVQKALNAEYEQNLELREQREALLQKVIEEERAKTPEPEVKIPVKKTSSIKSTVKPENVYSGPSLSYFGIY